MLLENPRYRTHRRSRRNPAMAGVRQWTQGIDAMDIGAAVVGIAAAALLPSYLIKTTPVTTTQKLIKLAVAAAATVGVGMLAKRMMSPAAGKAAIIGGLAGTATQAISMFTNVKLASQASLALPMGRVVPYPGPIARTYEPEFQNVGTV